MKRCFKCRRSLPLTEFYAHKQMADGHLNKCKACAKRDVRQHRAKNESVREYDRARAKTPERKAKMRETVVRWRQENPDGYRAHSVLGNAIQTGKITRQACEVCGSARTHGHHRDYSKPLEVIWLCARCHHKAHGLTRQTGAIT
jgi:hypothetical protein